MHAIPFYSHHTRKPTQQHITLCKLLTTCTTPDSHHHCLASYTFIWIQENKQGHCLFFCWNVYYVCMCVIFQRKYFTLPSHPCMYRAINPSSIHIQSTSLASANLIIFAAAATFAISFAPAFPWPSLMACWKAPCQALEWTHLRDMFSCFSCESFSGASIAFEGVPVGLSALACALAAALAGALAAALAAALPSFSSALQCVLWRSMLQSYYYNYYETGFRNILDFNRTIL